MSSATQQDFILSNILNINMVLMQFTLLLLPLDELMLLCTAIISQKPCLFETQEIYIVNGKIIQTLLF